MPKFDNPTRGYLLCPVCQSTSTAHQCGEGQLIATGEPPKNSRNIGLLYYRCPECGNSSISKKVSEYIEAHLVNDASALPVPPETEQVTEPITEQTDTLTEGELIPQSSLQQALSDEETEEKSPEPDKGFKLKCPLFWFGALMLVAWIFLKLKPKSKQDETEKEPANG